LSARKVRKGKDVGRLVKKDIVIAIVAVVIVLAVAFGLNSLRGNAPLTPSKPFTGDKSSAGDAAAADDKVVMRVNGQPVTEREFALMMQSAPEQARPFYATPEGRRAIADEIAKVKILEQEAKTMGIEEDPEIRTQLKMMKAQLMAGKALEKIVDQKSEEKIRAAYEKEKTGTMSLRHIVVAYQGGQLPGRGGAQAPSPEAAMQKANGIAAKIRGGADFGATARTESDDERTAPNGGMLGPFQPNQLPPEIASVVTKLQPGQVSAPVKTELGMHIFKVEQPTLEDLRPMLAQRVRQESAKTEIDRLHKAAKIDLDPQFFPPVPAQPSQPAAAPAAPKSQG
jgi:peptidyl-prolyl cis-trans isomerase C